MADVLRLDSPFAIGPSWNVEGSDFNDNDRRPPGPVYGRKAHHPFSDCSLAHSLRDCRKWHSLLLNRLWDRRSAHDTQLLGVRPESFRCMTGPNRAVCPE